MPPTSALNALGQLFERQFIHAWDLASAGSFEEANEIALWLVRDPAIGRYHRAGAHVILAHGPGNKVFHAKRALELLQGLNNFGSAVGDSSTPGPSKKQVAMKERLVKAAEDLVERAKKREAEFGDGPTPEQFDAMLEIERQKAREWDQAQATVAGKESQAPADSDSSAVGRGTIVGAGGAVSDEEDIALPTIDAEAPTEESQQDGEIPQDEEFQQDEEIQQSEAPSPTKTEYSEILRGFSPSRPLPTLDGLLTPPNSQEQAEEQRPVDDENEMLFDN